MFKVKYLSVDGFQLLQGCQDKNSRLAHAGFRLTQDVHAENSLWDAFVLNWNKEAQSRCHFQVLTV